MILRFFFCISFSIFNELLKNSDKEVRVLSTVATICARVLQYVDHKIVREREIMQ